MLVAEAIKKAGSTDKEKIREAMQALELRRRDGREGHAVQLPRRQAHRLRPQRHGGARLREATSRAGWSTPARSSSRRLQDFLELAVSATASGCIYGLVALAYLLMIRPTGIINFAVGEWAMVGAFGGFLLLSQLSSGPTPLGMAAGARRSCSLVGWATERIDGAAAGGAGRAARSRPILALLGMLVVFREVDLAQLPARPAAGAAAVRLRPPRARAARRLVPELLHHRRHARGVRRRLVLLRAHAVRARASRRWRSTAAPRR